MIATSLVFLSFFMVVSGPIKHLKGTAMLDS